MVLDFLKKQFIDVIDWTDEPGVLAMRYPMQDAEIQNGAQLTVRESQMAAFVNEGRVADVFGPGLYTLETANSADPHLADELGQDVPVAVQVGRLFLLDEGAARPEVGHRPAGDDPRQGIGPGPDPRLRLLFVPDRRRRAFLGQGDGHRREGPGRGSRAPAARGDRHRSGDRPRRRRHRLPRPRRQPDRSVREAQGSGRRRRSPNGASPCRASSSRACRCPRKCRSISTRRARCG